MIDEFFLKSAVNIRKQYLKISGNMNMYQKKAKEVINTLESSVSKLENIESKAKENNTGSQNSIQEILDVIKNVEEEGSELEKLIEPMNAEIEKLSKEETELYRKIKEKHTELTENQIIKSVEDRLNKEGLL